MKAEKLKKVKSFSELRVGMIVVIKDCQICSSSTCRKILIKLHKKAHLSMRGVYTTEEAFETLPLCSRANRNYIAHHTVDEGRLFRVDDGLEDEDEEAETKVAEKPRERLIPATTRRS